MLKKTIYLTPPQSLLDGFVMMILTGALLLHLPIASKSGESVGFLDALFTAASANCVTGLVVVNTAERWTWFGKIVILALIQFGALGFISVITIAMLMTHRQITLRNRLVIQASFNQDSIGGMVRLVKNVILITTVFETAGALLLAVSFYAGSTMTPWEAAYQGIFHSISAFCNAGFDNIGADGLLPFQSNVSVNLTIMVLIVAGGVGFTVWMEIGRFFKNEGKRIPRPRIAHLSLHCKIVSAVTGILILFGAVMFTLLEWRNPETLGDLPVWQKFMAALFQSVTLRTAGFNTIRQSGLSDASKFVSCILMMIGGSPASAAGGIKTVTAGVIVFSMISAIKGRGEVEAFGRSLPPDLLQRALTVASAMFAVVFVSSLLLHFTEQSNPYPHTFFDLLFEACSATGTVGVSAGITQSLSPAGKVVIIICMYLGRLSPVTVAIALNTKLNAGSGGIAYPKERVIIG